MIRALYTASSGMAAQQSNMDVISNNIANVNTNGYKKVRAGFKDMLYHQVNRPDPGVPVNLQVGSGVLMDSTLRSFEMGNIEHTGQPLDLAIDGDGFFVVANEAGEIQYTRDGSFRVSVDQQQNRWLVTSDGCYVLNAQLQPILLYGDAQDIRVDSLGNIFYNDGQNDIFVDSLALVRFPNPNGLEAVGSNNYVQTEASGAPTVDGVGDVWQYYLERSNVQVFEEMTKLIQAQRVYQLNSRTLQAADEMVALANNLRR
ncbi:MAG TPA: flagellar hook-basal body protein [Clostridiales bacterium]|nr:flagellar hook-basal body protein [Clostridiales bacterium]